MNILQQVANFLIRSSKSKFDSTKPSTSEDAADEETPLLLTDGQEDQESGSIFSLIPGFSSFKQSFRLIRTVRQQLFPVPTCFDQLIILLGTVFAFVHGVTLPLVAVIFGSLTNSYVQQAINGYANSSSSTPLSSTNHYAFFGLYNFTMGLLSKAKINEDDLVPIPKNSLSNSTTFGLPAEITDVMDLLNQIITQTFTKHQVLTKEQFIHFVHVTGNLFCTLALVVFGCAFMQILCWKWVAANEQSRKFKLREVLLDKILRQPFAWLQRQHKDDLIRDISHQVGPPLDRIAFKCGCIVEYTAMLLSAAIVAVVTNWRLGLVLCGPIPFILFRMLSVGKIITNKSWLEHNKFQIVDRMSKQVCSKVETVQAFGKEEHEIGRFSEAIKQAFGYAKEKYSLLSRERAMLEFFIYGCYALAFWYSCKLLMDQAISAGEIYTIFLSTTIGIIAISNIASLIPAIAFAFGVQLSSSSKVMLEIVEKTASDIVERIIPDEENPDEMELQPKIRKSLEIYEPTFGNIEFDNVTFSFNNEQDCVLKNLSFKIEPGQTVAIVSGPGEGKTTMANLLLRLYESQNGSIKLDGVDVKDYSLDVLRKHVNIATQNPYLKSGEINDAIRAGRAFITGQDIENAKRLVGAKYPESTIPLWDMRIEAMEVQRSSCMLRKINIARSIAGNPLILILDESFLTISPSEENSATKHIEGLRRDLLKMRKENNLTTILLTSQFLSLQRAKDLVDTVYVLQDGHIEPENIGSPSDLYERPGSLYQKHLRKEIKIIPRTFLSSRIVKPNWPSDAWFEETTKPAIGVKLRGIISNLIIPELKSTSKGNIWLGLIGSILTGIQLSLFSFYFVEIFGTFSKSGQRLADEGIFWSGMLLLLGLLSGVGHWLRIYHFNTATFDLFLLLRKKTFQLLVHTPKSYVRNNTATKIGLIARRNVPFIKAAVESHPQIYLSSTVTLICVSTIVYFLVWQIGRILVMIVIPILAVVAFLQFVSQLYGQKVNLDAEQKTSDVVSETLDAAELVHLFCMSKYYMKKCAKEMKPAIREMYKQAFILSLLFGWCKSLFFAFFGASFLVGSYLIELNEVEPQSLFKIFFAMTFCTISFTQIVAFIPDFARGIFSIGLINYLSVTNAAVRAKESMTTGRLPPSKSPPSIEFHNVIFHYPSTLFVLDQLNLKIPGGSTLIIHGASKLSAFGGSTMLYMLLKFYEIERAEFGKLLINDKDLNHLNARALRQTIGWVPQNLEFFKDESVAYNLAYGCRNPSGISDDMLMDVLNLVQIAEEFPKQVLRNDPKETIGNTITNCWDLMSHGTKVCLAIARAVLSTTPRILLLDSPTDLMSKTDEQKVVNAIKKVKVGRTCVIISNVLSTIEKLRSGEGASPQTDEDVNVVLIRKGKIASKA